MILKKRLKKIAFFLIAFFPMLILKLRGNVPFKKGFLITKFYFSAVLHHKSFFKSVKAFGLLFFKVSWDDFHPSYSLFNKRLYRTKNANKKIGRWQSINPETLQCETPISDTENMKFFSLGREAIWHILKSEKCEKKVALLPDFTCVTVILPFIQENWKIHFYSYNKDLTVNIQSFLDEFEKAKPSLCIFQPLSGMGFTDIEESLIDHAYKNGCITVVDQTQDIYNKKDNPSIDYYCSSLRKWYSFPDGGVLYSKKHTLTNSYDSQENSIFRTSIGLCMFAAHLLEVYGDPFFSFLYNFMWTFATSYLYNTNIVSRTMSEYSRKVLALQDEKNNAKIRKENFKFVYNGLKDLKCVKPAFDNIERLQSAPLNFHVYVENRSKFSSFLSSNGIATQIFWGMPPYIKKHVTLNETTKYIYSHIISLPCDQRYNLEDMKKMVDLIRKFDKNKEA